MLSELHRLRLVPFDDRFYILGPHRFMHDNGSPVIRDSQDHLAVEGLLDIDHALVYPLRGIKQGKTMILHCAVRRSHGQEMPHSVPFYYPMSVSRRAVPLRVGPYPQRRRYSYPRHAKRLFCIAYENYPALW